MHTYTDGIKINVTAAMGDMKRLGLKRAKPFGDGSRDNAMDLAIMRKPSTIYPLPSKLM
jgi:hypothetical protein